MVTLKNNTHNSKMQSWKVLWYFAFYLSYLSLIEIHRDSVAKTNVSFKKAFIAERTTGQKCMVPKVYVSAVDYSSDPLVSSQLLVLIGSHLEHSFSNFSWHRNSENILKHWFWLRDVWSEAQDYAFLTSSQVMLMPLQGPRFE